MLKSLSIFITILTLTSCQNDKSQIDIQLQELDIDPTNFDRIDTLRYSNSSIQSLTLFKTKSHYYKVSFYEDGLKKKFHQIKNNQFHGDAIDWFENGNKKWAREYDNGNSIGHNITFQENGFKKQDYNSENNTTVYFFENGNPRIKYADSSTTYYYDNGNIFEDYIYKFNSRNENSGSGFVKYYNENKGLIFEGGYDKNSFSKDGKKYNGKIICYFNDGKPSLLFDLKNGITDGKFFTYHGNGIMKFEGETIDAVDVYYKSYYPNGKPEYENDFRNNIERRWDKSGKLTE